MHLAFGSFAQYLTRNLYTNIYPIRFQFYEKYFRPTHVDDARTAWQSNLVLRYF